MGGKKYFGRVISTGVVRIPVFEDSKYILVSCSAEISSQKIYHLTTSDLQLSTALL